MKPADLTPHLAERVRALKDGPPATTGSHVLYWMHHAVRGHENPALDVAVTVGNAHGLPVLVYQGLGGRHPYDADRHHTFILEGARDAADELAARGLRHVFHLGYDTGASPLVTLARQAALVVTEDFPAPPFPDWTRRLARRIDTPIWAVDSCCVVPMRLAGRRFERAYAFRNAMTAAYEARVDRPWVDVEPRVGPHRGDPGFPPVDLGTADFAELCAACEIDHGIGPVRHTPGGSRAGYARWAAFRTNGLSSYARLRNDAANPVGVSRLSPYLHHGHVSPLRIAREAREDERGGARGAKKFLDELFVWRELAHNFCFHEAEPGGLSALPEWARDTLLAHAADERPARYSAERLARGRTGHRLWDAAQRSLLIHGELHNNVRMTWGKALLHWTDGPDEALARLIELNHRYALDGSDPNSYGGLLWCLGLFDRPFPEKPVTGTVRSRSIARHASRLDLETYESHVSRPSRANPLDVVVIGAGVAGLAAARTLLDHGLSVEVLDKGRGPGGRASTRREAELRFDHGAQYFTARDARFRRYVNSWRNEGLVAPWPDRIAALDAGGGRIGHEVDFEDNSAFDPRFVAVPGMSALAAHLAADLRVRQGVRVARAERTAASRWCLRDDGGEVVADADVLVVSAPAPQAAALLETEAPNLARRLEHVRLDPCIAAMLAFEEPIGAAADAFILHDSAVAWAARESAKPGRPDAEAWVLHARPAWSRRHLSTDPDDAAVALADALAEALHTPLPALAHAAGHRWRYARVATPLGADCAWDARLRLAACGDWCLGPRIEAAFLSGVAAAGRVLGLPDRAE